MIKEFKAQLIVTNKPKDIITLSTLYDVYYAWCIDEEYYDPLGKIKFSEYLAINGILRTTLGKNVTGYRGLKLSDDLEWFID